MLFSPNTQKYFVVLFSYISKSTDDISTKRQTMRGTLCSHTTDLNSKLASSLTSFTLYKVSMFLQPVSIWSKTPQFNRISDIPSVLPIVFGQLDIFLKLEFLLHRGPLRLVLYLPLLCKNQGGFSGTKNQLMLSYSISN